MTHELTGWFFNLVYLALCLVCSPWLLWRCLRDGKYREGWREKLWGQVPFRAHRDTSDRRCIWFHAVSLGEVNALATVLEHLQGQYPHIRCVISTTTKTGRDAAKRRYGSRHAVFYCPLDFTWAVEGALRAVRPDLLVLVELELWPNLIRCAGRAGVPIAVINGRLSPRSFRGYSRLKPIVSSLLQCISRIAVQDETYAERFRQLGALPRRVVVTGSLKFDGAQSDRDNPVTQRLANLAGIRAKDRIWLAGSTSAPEEQHVLWAFGQLAARYPQLRLILVPRHPERFEEVARWVGESGWPWARRSELPDGDPAVDRKRDSGTASAWRILLVDVLGELGAWWGTAQIAYVGGSMGARGGQNMIEPAGYGAAVSFGPRTENFREVVRQLLAVDGATVVADRVQLTQFVQTCLHHPDVARSQGSRARQRVLANRGATQRTVAVLTDLLAVSGLASYRRSA